MRCPRLSECIAAARPTTKHDGHSPGLDAFDTLWCSTDFAWKPFTCPANCDSLSAHGEAPLPNTPSPPPPCTHSARPRASPCLCAAASLAVRHTGSTSGQTSATGRASLSVCLPHPEPADGKWLTQYGSAQKYREGFYHLVTVQF